MSSHIFVHTSNRLEEIYELWIGRLFPGSHPLAKRIVVVPSPMMRSWLMEKMAKDERLGIAMGMEICYIAEAIQKLQKRDGRYFPSSFELGLKIDSICQETTDPKKRARLSIQLAALFEQYSLFGKEMVGSWRKGNPQGWQEKLFLTLFPKEGRWALPIESLEPAESYPSHLTISLFGLNFFPEIYHDFFSKISHQVEVSYYFLSPTPLYWGDMESDRELSRLRKGLSGAQEEEYEDYLALRHPLIANLGRLGRKMFRTLEDEGIWDDSRFVPPERSSLLGCVQADLYELEIEKKAAEPDGTIQIHEADSKLREVQILKNQLLALIRDKGISLRDIVVMSPDIGAYAPFIKAVFQEELPWRLFDLKSTSENPLFAGFLQLLELAESRFSAREVVRFISLEPVRKTFNLNPENIERIKEWIHAFGISWGMDEEDRKRAIRREVEDSCDESISDRGTWEKGFDLLLYEIMMTESRSVSFTETTIIGTLIEAVRSLKEDLKPIYENRAMTLPLWSEYLRSLYLAYFTGEEDHLLRVFDRLDKQESREAIEWSALSIHLRELFEQQTMNFREGHVDAIRFCSMLPMRAIPAKVVVMMGMTDGAFPLQQIPSPLNLNKEGSYSPTRADYDRYLFLESLLSAREALIILYSTNEETGPSSLVHALQGYLKTYYSLDCYPLRHPSLPSDPLYFTEGSGLISFDQNTYKMAKIVPCVERLPAETPYAKPQSISVSTLSAALKNPMKNYLSKSLGIYFEEEKLPPEEDSFLLSPLEKWKIEDEMSFRDPSAVLQEAKMKGKIAGGGIGEYVIGNLLKEGSSRVEFLGSSETHLLELGEGELVINGISIVGTVGRVSNKGLILNSKHDKDQRFKMWPQILLYLHLRAGPPTILYQKTKKALPCKLEDTKKWLEKLVEYALLTCAKPFPLDEKRSFELYMGKEKSEVDAGYRGELQWYLDRFGDNAEYPPIQELIPKEFFS